MVVVPLRIVSTRPRAALGSPYASISILVVRLQHALFNIAVRVTHCARKKGLFSRVAIFCRAHNTRILAPGKIINDG